jgi:hypothetical protein
VTSPLDFSVIALTVSVPVKIESSLNLREHWRKRANRNTSHRSAAYFALKSSKIKAELPAVVTLTRVAPRELDGDNLQGGMKSVRDGVADWFGVDDRDPRIKWDYGQRKGDVREYAAEVEVRLA